MKFLLYKLNNGENLIFDEDNKEIKFDKEIVERLPDKKAMSCMFENLDNLLSNTDDIAMYAVEKNSKLRISQNALFESTIRIGTLKIEVELNKLDKLKENGGFILVYHNNKESEIVYLGIRENNDFERKYYSQSKIDNEKNSILQTKNIKNNSKIFTENEKQINNFSKNVDSDYIEGIIRIPVQNTGNGELIETVKRVNDGNAQIYRSILQLSNKIDSLTSELAVGKHDESNNKRKVEELTNIIDGLRTDRTYLENEVQQSKLVALNDLKKQLKFSKVALDRHIDIEEFSTKKVLDDLFNLMFVALKKELSAKKILKNENEFDNALRKTMQQEVVLSSVRNIVDNIDSKIQSLQEIKKDFENLKISKETGE